MIPLKNLKKPLIITGLDIGSSKISAVALEVIGAGSSTILAYESRPSRGVSRGAITGLDEASGAIAEVLSRLGEKISARPSNIYANIGGETVRGERSRGMIPLSSRGREVTKSDIAKCVNAASTIRLTFDREIIHRVVLNFSIDDQPSIKNPLGLYASRLSCEMYMITANLNHIQNIYKCVNNAGYDIKETVYSGLADGTALLDDESREEGVMLVSAGASLTDLCAFFAGKLSLLDVVPTGADDIKGNLNESQAFNDIVNRTRVKIEEFTNKGGNIKSVTITGGLSFNEGVAELFEERLKIPVKMGAVKNLQGNISSMDALRGVTAIGLARYAMAQYQPARFEPKNMIHSISEKVTEIFNNYF